MDIDAYVEDLRSRLRDCPLTRPEIVARADGAFSVSWLNQFCNRHTNNPTVETLKALDSVLSEVRDV